MMDPRRLATLLDVAAVDVTNLGASHAWTLHRVRLPDGRDVFAKASDGHARSVFAAEAAGLRWLAAAGPGTPVPEVLACDDHILVLPWLAAGSPTSVAAERFGHELAALHAASPGRFGAPWPGYIADLPLDNAETDGRWSTWYAAHRLLPFLRLGAKYLTPQEVRVVEEVVATIDRHAGPPEPPSRIHGDLWSGNVFWTRDRALLIDPAAHGGHRETDLAMLALFGVPHLDRILAAYQEAAPLADGWAERVPLHQLHPLLVHLALYGTAYRRQVIAAAERLR